MINDDNDYNPSTMTEDIIIDNDYEHVVINGPDESNLGDCDNNVIVSEISETESNIEHTNSVWCDSSVRFLIYCLKKLRKQFKICPDLKKKSMWLHVSEFMGKSGFHFDAKTCETKWRDLKKVYMYNKIYRPKKYGFHSVNEENSADYSKESTYYDCFTTVAEYENSKTSISCLNTVSTVSLNDTNLKHVKQKSEDQSNTNVNIQTLQTLNGEIIENNIVKENTGLEEIWTEAATKCLIELRSLYHIRFLKATRRRKNLLWNKISDRLRENGYDYSGVVCKRKWILLKANYLTQKEKHKKLEVNTMKWLYFQDLDRLLSAPVKTISWSEDSTKYLIDCFDHLKEHLIHASTSEKLLIWKQIKKKMWLSGFYFSSKACFKKWQVLKNTYKKYKMLSKYNKKIIWVHYDKIDSVLKGINKNKIPRCNATNIKDKNNQSCDINELNKPHNYIPTKPNSCSFKTEAIAELKYLMMSNYAELNQKFIKMEDDFSRRERVFVDIGQQTLNALDKLNELETHLLGLLEQLILKLPNGKTP